MANHLHNLKSAIIFIVIMTRVLLGAGIVSSRRNKVAVISLDGFRADYYYENYTNLLTNLTLIAKHVQTVYLKPSFPTLTFPNHYTIATGVYPETHGIVHNEFWDPVVGHFSPNTMNISDYWPFWKALPAIEPIWVTAERQNVTTAVLMWPGLTDRGTLATKFSVYNQSISWQSRVDTLLDCLVGGVQLAMMYYHQPDQSGHRYGPDSMTTELKNIDWNIGYLLKSIRSRNLTDDLDLIICSDHGMSAVRGDSLIVFDELFDNKTNVTIDDLLDKEKYKPFYSQNGTDCDKRLHGSILHLWPSPGKEAYLYQQLINSSRNGSAFDVFLKGEIPAKWHYRNSSRIAPIVAVAKPGSQLAVHRSSQSNSSRGAHGYDNDFKEMRAIFFAMGPSFLSNITLKPFENVHIYSLIAHLVGLTQTQANNGSLKPFIASLKEFTSFTNQTSIKPSSSNQTNQTITDKTPPAVPDDISWKGVIAKVLGISAGAALTAFFVLSVVVVVRYIKKRKDYARLRSSHELHNFDNEVHF